MKQAIEAISDIVLCRTLAALERKPTVKKNYYTFAVQEPDCNPTYTDYRL